MNEWWSNSERNTKLLTASRYCPIDVAEERPILAGGRMNAVKFIAAAFVMQCAGCVVSPTEQTAHEPSEWYVEETSDIGSLPDPSAPPDLAAEALDEPLSRGACEDACELYHRHWSQLCARLSGNGARQCHSESMEGYGLCQKNCRNGCEAAGSAMFDRWDLYCGERCPWYYKGECNLRNRLGRAVFNRECG
ncbi:hypothetical protein [Sorangium sp. So ce204]|uniref:hypothetical protein n=1 Tax=Sorangium sp. So ce204 TaxID=3133288 RepID=UPI003F618DDD